MIPVIRDVTEAAGRSAPADAGALGLVLLLLVLTLLVAADLAAAARGGRARSHARILNVLLWPLAIALVVSLGSGAFGGAS